MISRWVMLISMLAVAMVVLASAPEESAALNPMHSCSFCHQMHGSPGGKLNIADQFNLVCDTCHGPAAAAQAKYADMHDDPNTVPVTWDLGCKVCHTPHSGVTSRYNFPPYVATAGDLHDHTLYAGDTGTNVPGINIKLYGRDEDGTGLAKVATPLRVLSEGVASCTLGNTQFEVSLPPFNTGDGPPHTVMVGDRIDISNGDAATTFNGTWRVLETNWDTWPTSGWVCFDIPGRPGPTLYPISDATWRVKKISGTNTGLAKITIGAHPYNPDDLITVQNVDPTGFNGTGRLVYAVTATTVEYVTLLVIDPGTFVPGTGEAVLPPPGSSGLAYLQSRGWQQRPTVRSATWSGGTATLALSSEHSMVVDDSVNVIGVTPTGYNGLQTVTAVTQSSVSYAVGDPGASGSGGVVEYVGSVKGIQTALSNGTSQIVFALDANSDSAILDIHTAAGATRDGDILTVYGSNPARYDGRWEVTNVDLVATPPTVTVRCPPYLRTTLSLPACAYPPVDGAAVPVTGGVIQSSGSMRATVLDSRAGDNADARFLGDTEHAFTNTDQDGDGWMDGPCEICHTLTSKHLNDDYGNTHNNARTCTNQCHFHSQGFDKANIFCPPGRVCPPID